MTEVLPNLYLGGVEVLTSKFLTSNNIRNVVSVDTVSPDVDFNSYGVKQVFIEITDEESSSLFVHFAPVSDILIKAVNESQASLVHCRHGVSRSATLVIATLMKLNNIDCEAALQLVKSKHREACPNPGFIRQLKLWHILQYNIDLSHINLRLFLFHADLNMSDFPEGLAENCEDTISSPGPSYGFKCSKCRKILFTSSDIIPHEAKWWQHFSRHQTCNKGYSILPQSWTNNRWKQSGQSKLVCTCNQKLGNVYSKDCENIRCLCGTLLVGPVILVNPTRVDKSLFNITLHQIKL